MKVKAKKHLGQHFLTSHQVAYDIAHALTGKGYTKVLEIGPGKGIITEELFNTYRDNLTVIDIDSESIAYLRKYFAHLGDKIIEGDFLQMPLSDIIKDKFGIIGNYPYHISTQIMFKVLENKDHIIEAAGMFQKEVAVRIASPPGKKSYGLTSVLLQTWFDIEYLFTVGPEHFDPPPKVQSGVIRMTRNSRKEIDIPEKFYKRTIKTAFGQRRKTLNNSLKPMINEFNTKLPTQYASKRPEQLGVEEFLEISQLLYTASQSSSESQDSTH